jgi:RNA polymerase sigma-70 factor (ECF subfamily)
MHGARAIARAAISFWGQIEKWGLTLHAARVNGQPGFRLTDADGRIVNVAEVDVEGGRITAIHSIVNPDKLRHLGPTSDVALRPSVR